MSCTPLRKTTQTKQQVVEHLTQTATTVAESKSERVSESSSTIRAESTTQSSEQGITITETFDTSLPVDSATGTPPLKVRITKQAHKAEIATTVATTAAAATSHSSEQVKVQQEVATDIKIDTATEIKETQKRGINWWQQTLCGIGALALLWIAFKLIFKHFKIKSL